MCDEPCQILDKLKALVKEMEKKQHRHPGPMWLQLAIVPAPKSKIKSNEKNNEQKSAGKIDDNENFIKVKKSKSRELRAGRLYKGCDCEMHNGLQDKCPRTECHGSPECLHQPDPICGPSEFAGGKHYTKLTEERRIKYAQAFEARKAELMKSKNQSGKEDSSKDKTGTSDSPKDAFYIQYVPCPVCPNNGCNCACDKPTTCEHVIVCCND